MSHNNNFVFKKEKSYLAMCRLTTSQWRLTYSGDSKEGGLEAGRAISPQIFAWPLFAPPPNFCLISRSFG